MWSEHCSPYKSSKGRTCADCRRAVRRCCKGRAKTRVRGVDIGDGLVAAFKMEPHNHPELCRAVSGCDDRVGGILRDIFTMGARPIAVLDLAAVRPNNAFERVLQRKRCGRNRQRNHRAQSAHQVDGVVRGIAHYGNCFGVPTVGGEVQFEPGYSANPLVNVLALGIGKKDQLFLSKAQGAGNPVIYVGAKTGRDGIHGASLLASAEFSEESQQKRPNVQVGDPFMEKLLLEACLEAMRTGAIVAIQDMGAAGLTSSSCEMASRGGLGIQIDLSLVPQREPGMTAYEMMLSESQERMLLVAERGRENEVLSVFARMGP